MSTPTPPAAAPHLVVMGVSGSGKSTVGELVAKTLGVRFVDGDALHPSSNVAKMAAGTPLDDTDRWPWLAAVGRELAGSGASGLVVACSALKRSYRDAILAEAPDTVFLYLSGSRETLLHRLEGRSGHFMPPSLLDSQLATLEPLGPDEPGVVVNIDAPVAMIVVDAVAGIHALRLASS